MDQETGFDNMIIKTHLSLIAHLFHHPALGEPNGLLKRRTFLISYLLLSKGSEIINGHPIPSPGLQPLLKPLCTTFYKDKCKLNHPTLEWPAPGSAFHYEIVMKIFADLASSLQQSLKVRFLLINHEYPM